MADSTFSSFRAYGLLVAPIAAVALLVSLRAVAQGTPAPTEPPVAELNVDAGASASPVASAEGDDEEEDEVAEFDGELPSIDHMTPYPAAQDLLAQAVLGDDGRYTVLREGKKVALTLDPVLQRKVEGLLTSYAPPYAAVAAIEPSTGRVLALAEFSRGEGKPRLGLRAVYPAASVFKVVTGAALLEAGVDPDQEVCFHGGKHRIQPKLLVDSKSDRRCADMSEAMAKSTNVVFAKLARDHLTPKSLTEMAGRFGFNRDLPFDMPAERSDARIPETPFEFATTAAGFGEVYLSPLHGALLASTIANDGRMPEPFLLDDGRHGSPGKRVIDASASKQLAEMMTLAVSEGTARKAFREGRRPALPGIQAAGKTGSLDHKSPYHAYSWFVGYAPVEAPKVAVAAVVVNDAKWRIHAPYVAREALRFFLQPEAHKAVSQARTTKARGRLARR